MNRQATPARVVVIKQSIVSLDHYYKAFKWATARNPGVPICGILIGSPDEWQQLTKAPGAIPQYCYASGIRPLNLYNRIRIVLWLRAIRPVHVVICAHPHWRGPALNAIFLCALASVDQISLIFPNGTHITTSGRIAQHNLLWKGVIYGILEFILKLVLCPLMICIAVLAILSRIFVRSVNTCERKAAYISR